MCYNATLEFVWTFSGWLLKHCQDSMVRSGTRLQICKVLLRCNALNLAAFAISPTEQNESPAGFEQQKINSCKNVQSYSIPNPCFTLIIWTQLSVQIQVSLTVDWLYLPSHSPSARVSGCTCAAWGNSEGALILTPALNGLTMKWKLSEAEWTEEYTLQRSLFKLRGYRFI